MKVQLLIFVTIHHPSCRAFWWKRFDRFFKLSLAVNWNSMLSFLQQES